MSRLVLPCDTSLRISFWRGVRPSDRLATGFVTVAFLAARVALAGLERFGVLVVFFERICLRGAISCNPKFYC